MHYRNFIAMTKLCKWRHEDYHKELSITLTDFGGAISDTRNFDVFELKNAVPSRFAWNFA